MKSPYSPLKNAALFGILFSFLLGSMLHFVYDLTACNVFIGYFVPVNESVWEHLKLCFFSWLIYGIACYPTLYAKASNFWFGIWSGSLLGNTFIVIFFYTYTGILGHSILFLDILSYFLACVITACFFYKVISMESMYKADSLGILLLLCTILTFTSFTYSPPASPIFTDPAASSASQIISPPSYETL